MHPDFARVVDVLFPPGRANGYLHLRADPESPESAEALCWRRPLDSQWIELGPFAPRPVSEFLGKWAHAELFFAPALRRDVAGVTRAPLPALWTDLPFGLLAPKMGAPAPGVAPGGEEKARQRLARVPLAPSLVVHTGSSLTALWLLREALSDPGQEVQWLHRLASLVDTIAASPEGLVRIPGSMNRSIFPSAPVTLEVCEPERRYGAGELAAALAHLTVRR